jgi:hypothetical protein
MRIGTQDASGWIGYRIARRVTVVLVPTLVLLGGPSLAHADVPKPADIAACNGEAQEATRKGSASRGASPNARDHSRAAHARGGAASATLGGDPRASDPQLEGMDPDGAMEPAYQAAYRTCMRKAGF